jgi:hypothetical protein
MSAYASMRRVGNITTPEEKADLIRWGAERWLNLTARITDHLKLPCGTKGERQKELRLPSVCRPSVKINERTPSLSSTFTDNQIKKAIEIKSKGKTIKWKEL